MIILNQLVVCNQKLLDLSTKFIPKSIPQRLSGNCCEGSGYRESLDYKIGSDKRTHRDIRISCIRQLPQILLIWRTASQTLSWYKLTHCLRITLPKSSLWWISQKYPSRNSPKSLPASIKSSLSLSQVISLLRLGSQTINCPRCLFNCDTTSNWSFLKRQKFPAWYTTQNLSQSRYTGSTLYRLILFIFSDSQFCHLAIHLCSDIIIYQ